MFWFLSQNILVVDNISLLYQIELNLVFQRSYLSFYTTKKEY